jgi:lipid-A-disaccharide synthase
VPELIQGEMTPQRIALEAKQILQDRARTDEIKAEFRLIKDKLGGKGASHRVARIALQMMGTA